MASGLCLIIAAILMCFSINARAQIPNPLSFALTSSGDIPCGVGIGSRALIAAGAHSTYYIPRGQQLVITDIHGAITSAGGKPGDGVLIQIGRELQPAEAPTSTARIGIYVTLDNTGSANVAANIISGVPIPAFKSGTDEYATAVCVWFQVTTQAGGLPTPPRPDPADHATLFLNGYLQAIPAAAPSFR